MLYITIYTLKGIFLYIFVIKEKLIIFNDVNWGGGGGKGDVVYWYEWYSIANGIKSRTNTIIL